MDPEIGDAIRLPVGKRLKQHAVDDAEHRRRGADAERKRQDGEDGEPGTARQRPPCVAQILDQGRHASAL